LAVAGFVTVANIIIFARNASHFWRMSDPSTRGAGVNRARIPIIHNRCGASRASTRAVAHFGSIAGVSISTRHTGWYGKMRHAAAGITGISGARIPIIDTHHGASGAAPESITSIGVCACIPIIARDASTGVDMNHPLRRIARINGAHIAVIHHRGHSSWAASRAIALAHPVALIAIITTDPRGNRRMTHASARITSIRSARIAIVHNRRCACRAGPWAVAQFSTITGISVVTRCSTRNWCMNHAAQRITWILRARIPIIYNRRRSSHTTASPVTQAHAVTNIRIIARNARRYRSMNHPSRRRTRISCTNIPIIHNRRSARQASASSITQFSPIAGISIAAAGIDGHRSVARLPGGGIAGVRGAQIVIAHRRAGHRVGVWPDDETVNVVRLTASRHIQRHSEAQIGVVAAVERLALRCGQGKIYPNKLPLGQIEQRNGAQMLAINAGRGGIHVELSIPVPSGIQLSARDPYIIAHYCRRRLRIFTDARWIAHRDVSHSRELQGLSALAVRRAALQRASARGFGPIRQKLKT
jgi:hypothetical protein